MKSAPHHLKNFFSLCFVWSLLQRRSKDALICSRLLHFPGGLLCIQSYRVWRWKITAAFIIPLLFIWWNSACISWKQKAENGWPKKNKKTCDGMKKGGFGITNHRATVNLLWFKSSLTCCLFKSSIGSSPALELLGQGILKMRVFWDPWPMDNPAKHVTGAGCCTMNGYKNVLRPSILGFSYDDIPNIPVAKQSLGWKLY